MSKPLRAARRYSRQTRRRSGPASSQRALAVGVEALGPVAQRLGVVVAEALDVLGLEAGALERLEHARELQRLAVGEDVAVRERAGVGVGVAQAGDAVVEQPAARRQQRRELAGVLVDLLVADVLDHADAGDRVELLAGEVAVVHHADLDPLADAGRLGPLARDPRLRLRERDPEDLAPWRLAAWIAKLPQPQPTSSTRSPALEGELACRPARASPPGPPRASGAAREDRAAVGHRRVQEEREELRRHVVVVAHGPASRSVEWRSPRGRSSACGGSAAASARSRPGPPRTSRSRGVDPIGGGFQLSSRPITLSMSSTSRSPAT